MQKIAGKKGHWLPIIPFSKKKKRKKEKEKKKKKRKKKEIRLFHIKIICRSLKSRKDQGLAVFSEGHYCQETYF